MTAAPLNSSHTYQEGSSKRLAKLDTIRGLFIWPMALWFCIVAADFVIYVIGIESFRAVRSILAEIAFYTLPLLLIYLVFITFYSSYRLLGSREHKNIAAFFFFQFLAFFAIEQLGIEVPVYGKAVSAALTFIIAAAITLLFIGFQRFVPIPGGQPGEQELRKPSEVTGMIIAGLFSLIIASMIYFRVRGGIAFVSWGVFFGSLLSAMLIKADKMILCFLYFLDPRGAESLFQLIKLKERVQLQKSQSEVEIEVGSLHKEEMKTTALRLANELDQAVSRVYFKRGERRIRILIEGLRDFENRPQEEQDHMLTEVRGLIEELRVSQDIPKRLPEVDYSSLSIGEKILQLIGLSEDEINRAVAEGLINPEQRHLWTFQNQGKIRAAIDDFNENKMRGTAPVFVAESLGEFFDSNRFILRRLAEILAGDVPPELRAIVGAEQKGLQELIFSTVTTTYSCVLKRGSEGSFLILGVFERPEIIDAEPVGSGATNS